MDMNRRSIASSGNLHRLFAAYLVCGAVLTVLRVGTQAVGGPLLVAIHLAGAGLLLTLADRGRLPDRGRNHVWPFVLWMLAWLELGWIFAWSGEAGHDGAVRALEVALLGGHGHLWLPARLPGLVPAMHIIYVSYYGLVLGPAVLLSRLGRHEECRRYTFVVMATYLTCFFLYQVYPVVGPRGGEVSTLDAGFRAGAAGFEELLRSLGDSLGTAFPSSHCAGSWAAAMAAGSLTGARLRTALIIWAVLITVSTVMTGNHYGIDALAGAVAALAVRGVVVGSGHLINWAPRREVCS